MLTLLEKLVVEQHLRNETYDHMWELQRALTRALASKGSDLVEFEWTISDDCKTITLRGEEVDYDNVFTTIIEHVMPLEIAVDKEKFTEYFKNLTDEY